MQFVEEFHQRHGGAPGGADQGLVGLGIELVFAFEVGLDSAAQGVDGRACKPQIAWRPHESALALEMREQVAQMIQGNADFFGPILWAGGLEPGCQGVLENVLCSSSRCGVEDSPVFGQAGQILLVDDSLIGFQAGDGKLGGLARDIVRQASPHGGSGHARAHGFLSVEFG